MNRKKLILSFLMVVIIALVSIVPSIVYALPTTPLYLGITELRTNDTPNMGYAIGDPNTNQETGNAAKIWNIVEYTGPGDSAQ